jgi:hypothetical protein
LLFINIILPHTDITVSMATKEAVHFWAEQAVKRKVVEAMRLEAETKRKAAEEMSKALALVAEAMRLDAEAKRLDALVQVNCDYLKDPSMNKLQLLDAEIAIRNLRLAAAKIRERYYMPCYT